jgi:gluconate 2-dehydrogenase gamma chain
MRKLYDIRQNRRSFIKTTATGLAGMGILSNCTGPVSTWRFFSAEESKVMIAIAEQIVPADDDPGATDAHVINFLDRQLVSNLKEYQELYRTGLQSLQEFCMARHNKKFEDLPWDDQFEILTDIENGRVDGKYWENIDPGYFFSTVRTHTMMGFYGPPRHGGNRDLVSYRMLGFDYPQVIGRNKNVSRES